MALKAEYLLCESESVPTVADAGDHLENLEVGILDSTPPRFFIDGVELIKGESREDFLARKKAHDELIRYSQPYPVARVDPDFRAK